MERVTDLAVMFLGFDLPPHNPWLIPVFCAGRRITPLLSCSAARRLNGRPGATVTAGFCADRTPTTQDCRTLPSINPCVSIWTSCRTGQLRAQHSHQPSGFCVVCLTSSSRSAARPPPRQDMRDHLLLHVAGAGGRGSELCASIGFISPVSCPSPCDHV